ncbi:unnamed protein product [Rotaria sordida]|uniref:ADP ribosyltransferase domain-containing protein n=2 Tax=Rotaria sordida TaxID=392033 RepID=A0A818PKK7_9BILA|nr:unnamed protein product [Rotaria sordida]
MNMFGAGIKFTMGFGDTTGKMWDPNHIRYPQQAASILDACPDVEFRQVVQNRIRLELEKNQGKIVSINGCWSTSRNEEVARMFGSIGSRPAETNGESILFEININLNASDCILADISKYSALPIEEEVLFDLDATFTIENITEKKENNVPYWLVRMNAVKNSGMACILKSIEQHRLYDSTGFDVMWSAQPSVNPFECLLQLNNQLHYLHRFEMMTLDGSKSVKVKEDDAPLLHHITAVKLILSVGSRPELNIDEQKILCQGIMHLTLSVHLLTLDKRYELVRWPQRAVGLIHYKGCDYVRALEQWTRIIDDNGKSDPFHTAICCFYLGLTYSKLKQYKQAIEAFERALVHIDTMPVIFEAQYQMQIGHSIELQGIETYGCYPPARVHYEKALDFYESRIELPDEVALALCYAWNYWQL